MLLDEGWLAEARRVPSPHYDCRPDDETPSLLVVHNISLPPGDLAAHGSTRCLRARLIPMPILILPESPICAFLPIV